MPRGTIKHLPPNKSFGFLSPDGGGRDVFFHRDACVGVAFESLKRGMVVEFVDGTPSQKGPTAREVRPLEGAATPAHAHRQPEGAAAFINPYNFVRWLPAPVEDAATRAPLLGKTAPPPHDRYLGLTGRLRCVMVTATETFVSDSYGVASRTVEGGKEHRTYRFFRDPDGRAAVPASSLRGAVRTVFEAATNSCFLKVHAEAVHAHRDGRGKKVPYDLSVGDLVPTHLQPCSDADALCPACRTFGWVAPEVDATATRKAPAYRGRVRFTDAVFTEADALVQPDRPRTLPALSAPRPGYVWFYLMGQSGRIRDGLDAEQAGYVPGNAIRGRKLYWYYEPVDGPGRVAPTDQNRSIRDWVRPEARAEFEVFFENLAPSELGALLWSLELEGEQVHRIGYAKPLGFGSAWVTVASGEVISPDRYAAAGGESWCPVSPAELGAYKDRFREDLVERYGGAQGAEAPAEFPDLRNVADLCELLAYADHDAPVAYPRITPEDKGFEWFERNRKRDHQALPPADAEVPELPL
jgi:cold shock CspA family protein